MPREYHIERAVARGQMTEHDAEEVRRFAAFLADAGHPRHEPERNAAAYKKHYPEDHARALAEHRARQAREGADRG